MQQDSWGFSTSVRSNGDSLEKNQMCFGVGDPHDSVNFAESRNKWERKALELAQERLASLDPTSPAAQQALRLIEKGWGWNALIAVNKALGLVKGDWVLLPG